jgi:hypothetical protein
MRRSRDTRPLPMCIALLPLHAVWGRLMTQTARGWGPPGALPRPDEGASVRCPGSVTGSCNRLVKTGAGRGHCDGCRLRFAAVICCINGCAEITRSLSRRWRNHQGVDYRGRWVCAAGHWDAFMMCPDGERAQVADDGSFTCADTKHRFWAVDCPNCNDGLASAFAETVVCHICGWRRPKTG